MYSHYSANQRKRVLFACVPGDGHFNPLTGLAVHLQQLGYDVRWYTSAMYADKLKKLQIQHYPLKRALDISTAALEAERNKLKGKVKLLTFDLVNVFVLRSPEYFEDIKEIQATFSFDMVICDCMFTALPFIRHKLKVPVLAIGVLPLIETSKDLFPMGLGLIPSNTFLGRRKQDMLRFVADKILFRKPNRLMASLLKKEGLAMNGSNLFDATVRSASLFLQSGTPGFEYKRSDLGKNVRFIGALLPFSGNKQKNNWYHDKLIQYKTVILVTQGTVEKDVSKLLEPTLEAFKNTDCLVIATTGGNGTSKLKEKYPQPNLLIEDFVPFNEVMPYVHVYITNGGYGGVMLSIMHNVPMVAAGVHEGKNEINARIGYFNLGVNLQTERPTPVQLREGVATVFNDRKYKTNVINLSREFSRYDPNELCAAYITEVVG